MSQLHSLNEVKAVFGAGATGLEFSELKDEKGIRIGIRPSGGKFLERSTWQSLNDIIRDMGGQYVKESKCWVVPLAPTSKPVEPQKSLPASPALDTNERKFAIENLNRVLDEVPKRDLEWSEEALATIARGVLLLLEEKK